MTKHNDYLFQIEDDELLFLRQFDEMYHNCQDPHGQTKVLTRIDYQFVGQLTRRLTELLHQDKSRHRLNILDLGCGLGTFTQYLKKSFTDAEVSGCDISETALEKARISAPDCDFFMLDLKEKPSNEKTFDLLIALHVLCYFTEDEIRNVIRHLGILMNPGAFLLVGYHLPENMRFGRYITSLNDARCLFELESFSMRFGMDIMDDLDVTYAGSPVGRNIYFVVQKSR